MFFKEKYTSLGCPTDGSGEMRHKIESFFLRLVSSGLEKVSPNIGLNDEDKCYKQ